MISVGATQSAKEDFIPAEVSESAVKKEACDGANR